MRPPLLRPHLLQDPSLEPSCIASTDSLLELFQGLVVPSPDAILAVDRNPPMLVALAASANLNAGVHLELPTIVLDEEHHEIWRGLVTTSH
jgi:hypothetical protein